MTYNGWYAIKRTKPNCTKPKITFSLAILAFQDSVYGLVTEVPQYEECRSN